MCQIPIRKDTSGSNGEVTKIALFCVLDLFSMFVYSCNQIVYLALKSKLCSFPPASIAMKITEQIIRSQRCRWYSPLFSQA